MNGKLYIVSTPIGNLEDITLRALKTLRETEYIACEDTRRSKILFSHYNITNKKLISFYSYNQFQKIRTIIQILKSGKDVAIISDGGTPGISDPAYHLVKECISNNIEVYPLPGPTAFIPAIICSGLPTKEFLFLGFLPRKTGKLKKKLLELKEIRKTIVFYESPHRLTKTLEKCFEVFGDADCSIARELTKKFQEFIRGKLSTIIEQLKNRNVKGEIVVTLKP